MSLYSQQTVNYNFDTSHSHGVYDQSATQSIDLWCGADPSPKGSESGKMLCTSLEYFVVYPGVVANELLARVPVAQREHIASVNIFPFTTSLTLRYHDLDAENRAASISSASAHIGLPKTCPRDGVRIYVDDKGATNVNGAQVAPEDLLQHLRRLDPAPKLACYSLASTAERPLRNAIGVITTVAELDLPLEVYADSTFKVDIQKGLAALPHPRKHYWWAYAARGANEDMWHAPQGVHDLLRALYYFKSADWKGNRPFALKSWTAAELAKMPTYYIMDLNKGIAETMAAEMPSKTQIAACHWMTEEDLRVYSTEYVRTGFQGGLNSYRTLTESRYSAELNSLSGRTIDIPSCFIGGSSDWGPRQSPSALDAMQHGACTRLLGVHLVDGAGHSIPEEQPEQVNTILIDFLQRAEVRRAV